MKDNLIHRTKAHVPPKTRTFFAAKDQLGSSFFQPKLSIGPVDDPYEREADAVAEKVMRMPDKERFKTPTSPVAIQRKCAMCEEEEKVHRKENNKSTEPGAAPQVVNQALQTGGKPLDAGTQAFMESRMGYDFSKVQIHTGTVSAKSAQAINALAYTSGNSIVFNDGQYAPGTDSGKKLLAHELTHVVQQSNSLQPKKIQRALGRFTRCAANVHNAPADPLAAILQMNNRAELMSLGASHLLFTESLFIQSATFGPSTTFGFYRRRFGDPVAAGTKFKNRFDNTLHNTLLLAQAAELQSLSVSMRNISTFLGRNLHFICTGNSHTTIGRCSHHCNPGDAMATCSAGHGNTVAVCPDFWTFGTSEQQAIGLIHEVLHMTRGLGDHDTAPFAQTAGQRRGEPECYASLVADIYGIAPQDPSCPVI